LADPSAAVRIKRRRENSEFTGTESLDILRDLQSAFTANRDAANRQPELPSARASDQSIESRLAAIGCVAVNDAALGRFIEGGNQSANLFDIGLGRAASAFLQ
jgi:hypothetical protein